MKYSRYGVPDHKDRSKAWWNGHTPAPVEFYVFADHGAAGLWTIPEDILKAVRAVQESLKQNAFLKKETAERMLTPYESGWAMGWVVSNFGFGHSGYNDPGWASSLWGTTNLRHLCDKSIEKRREKKKKRTPEELKKYNEEKAWREKQEKLNEEIAKELGHRGLAMMTNSVEGVYALGKTLNAFAYAEKWAISPTIGGGPREHIPCAAYDQLIIGEWRDWVGKWGVEDEWEVLEKDGEPYISLNNLPAMRMVTAARPAHRYPEGKTAIELMIDGFGLQKMVRLGWKKEERVVEIWTFFEVITLEKNKQEATKGEQANHDAAEVIKG